jgi:signal transduction histidine kinase
MTCGVLTVDREGSITTLNDHARAILDLPEEGTLGRPCQEVLEHCPRLAQVLIESFSMSAPPSRAEMEIRTRDQRGRSIGFSISMIGAADGSIEGAALFFKDLTKVEEQDERERLRDRLAALGTMAARMAHEIRNPLTSIGVSASLLQRRLSAKGEPVDMLAKIGAEVVRIESTIAHCLEYARPLTPASVSTDPAALLDEALALARLRRGSDGVRVERHYAADLPTVKCDRALIRESLINILVNAYESLGGRGSITLSIECARGAERVLVIRITDSGPGVPPELIDRIFYPFFTTKTNGSGIGLASARKAVESHGGWLDVESELGRSTTFIMKLPVAGAASGAHA